MAGTLKCARLEFSGCRVKPRAAVWREKKRENGREGKKERKCGRSRGGGLGKGVSGGGNEKKKSKNQKKLKKCAENLLPQKQEKMKKC